MSPRNENAKCHEEERKFPQDFEGGGKIGIRERKWAGAQPRQSRTGPPVSKGFYLRDLVLHRTVLLGWRDGECGVICLVFLDPQVVFLTSDPKSSCSAEDFDSRYTWDRQQEPTS